MIYIAVADWFTRTEITYIQVTQPPYLKLRDFGKTYLGYLNISRQNRVCSPKFSILTFDFVFSIPQSCIFFTFVEMCVCVCGGGGGVHGNHK